MRNYLLVVFIIGFYFSFAQVGVDTDTPTEKLDVEGTARVRDLPVNGTENAISTLPDGTNSPTQDQTFKATKTVVVDDNGVLGVENTLPSSMKSSFAFKAFPTNEISDSNSDAIYVEKDCLRLMLDPETYTTIDRIFFYGQIKPSCLSARQDTFRAIAHETGGDSGNPSQEHWRRVDLKVSNGDTQDDFTYFNTFYQRISTGPVFYGRIFIPEMQQLYSFTYTGEYDSTKDRYEISLAIERIH